MTFSARQNNQSWDTYSSSSAPSASSSSSSLPMALQGCTLNEYVHQVTRRTDLVSTVSAIKTACKGIAAKAALGSTQQDSKSVYESAHELLVDELARTSCVQRISSAFENQPRDCSGRGLVVVMQPLVPTSSLFPDNSPTGTLFAVYDANCPSDKDPVMQKGKKALAAGYCLYGSSTTLFLSVGDGVHGWTLDPVQGTYVCTHPNVRLPEHGRLLALDTAEVMEWPESLCKYAKTVCEGRGKSGTAYAMRFTGSVVADFHNVLLIGGLAGCPYAEINLMHECIPLSYLAEQAGGKATDGFGYRILNIEPIHREECMPAFMGCFGDVAELESYGTVRVEELHPPVSAFASRY